MPLLNIIMRTIGPFNSPCYMLALVGMVSVIGGFSGGVNGEIHIVDGGYEGVVVKVDESVPAHECTSLFGGLEVNTTALPSFR